MWRLEASWVNLVILLVETPLILWRTMPVCSTLLPGLPGTTLSICMPSVLNTGYTGLVAFKNVTGSVPIEVPGMVMAGIDNVKLPSIRTVMSTNPIKDNAASIRLKNDPAAYILSFVILLDFSISSSFGSTNAPGRIASNKTPIESIFIPSARAMIPCPNSCMTITVMRAIIPYANGMKIGEPGTGTPGSINDTWGADSKVLREIRTKYTINIMKNTVMGIPTFIVTFQNLGLLWAVLSMKPRNLLVFLIRIGKLMSIFNLSLNRIAAIHITANPMA